MLHLLKRKIHNYISEPDRFLKEFDRGHPQLSESQREEVEKHQRVSSLRDKKQEKTDQSQIWEAF